jgi:hypothetical protein
MQLAAKSSGGAKAGAGTSGCQVEALGDGAAELPGADESRVETIPRADGIHDAQWACVVEGGGE